ncbi:Lrp/AsnC ligand binding domain-containing protein [Halomicroarcula sp. GCM10025709]|uniref:Lrp/AsnC ligand binding domain-containing protein n=1 Tax=Haloarcula TaxID=2237 RepID=UPI0024C35031|nr:Lrp/AsnC ligand binding domain-containing protein [Halomicroarcula sp. YJ-61-S]
MVDAFIMLKTDTGKSDELLAEVQALPGISEAHIVAGQYDIVAEASGEVYDVMQSVATQVRDIEGVLDTRTYVCLE